MFQIYYVMDGKYVEDNKLASIFSHNFRFVCNNVTYFADLHPEESVLLVIFILLILVVGYWSSLYPVRVVSRIMTWRKAIY